MQTLARGRLLYALEHIPELLVKLNSVCVHINSLRPVVTGLVMANKDGVADTVTATVQWP